jgi:hypothetical protein
MPQRWSVQNAKAKLSEVLARARAGAPQRIGLEESCVVISEADWVQGKGPSLGAWLVDAAPRGKPLATPSRKSKRGDPFASPRNRPGKARRKAKKA